jgi:seryl-tRNA synthetase
MPSLTVDLENTTPEYLGQVRYALTFLSEDVVSYEIDESTRQVIVEFRPETDVEAMRGGVDQLLHRYQQSEFGSKSVLYFDQRRELPEIDAWAGLLERRWATPVGEGHVILRGLAAQLQALVDRKVLSMFAREFKAELEIFPSTIRSETLHRCNHFTSFPEHMDFVSHLKQDLEVLSGFSSACRTDGWSPALHEAKMSAHDFAVSPSCCYHAYEGMEGWDLGKPGRCITATLNCHRYEGANHKSLSRLRSFNMREVVWVGQPAWVISSRARAEELIREWARDWELSCTFENANDMFFTDDFAVKASFQRQQEAKRELRMDIPADKNSISVFSSNFHATTFGKAFGITVGGRPVVSACVGWGLERWVYALFSQFGFDPAKWPAGLKRDYDAFTAGEVLSHG